MALKRYYSLVDTNYPNLKLFKLETLKRGMQKWKKCTRLIIHVLRYRSVSFVNILTLCYLAYIGTAHTEKPLSKLSS